MREDRAGYKRAVKPVSIAVEVSDQKPPFLRRPGVLAVEGDVFLSALSS